MTIDAVVMGDPFVRSDMHFSVSAPHFEAAVSVAHDGIIWGAPPILHYARNRPWAWFRRYAANKGWRIEKLCAGRE